MSVVACDWCGQPTDLNRLYEGRPMCLECFNGRPNADPDDTDYPERWRDGEAATRNESEDDCDE